MHIDPRNVFNANIISKINAYLFTYEALKLRCVFKSFPGISDTLSRRAANIFYRKDGSNDGIAKWYSSYWCVQHVTHHHRSPWPEMEELLAQTAYSAYWYAHHGLGCKRFVIGEPAIAKEKKYIWYYCHYVTKEDRFESCERLMLRNAWNIIWYVDTILKRRWPECETKLKKHKHIYAEYAKKYIPQKE